ALVLAEVEDLDDAGMVEPRQVAGLALEAGGEVALLKDSKTRHLDDDVAIEECVVDAVDVGHAALAELLLHDVATVGELQADPVGSVPGHWLVDHAEQRKKESTSLPGYQGPRRSVNELLYFLPGTGSGKRAQRSFEKFW